MSAGNKILSFRVQVSALLICFAAIAWVMPDRQRAANELKPSEMLALLDVPSRLLSSDQVAKMVVDEDPTMLLIDIREQADYLKESIPGAINIPFRDILNPDWSGYLDDPEITAILYSSGDILASEAWMLCTQTGYRNTRIMKGGMGSWHELIMESEFSGERISAAENALYETRYRARDYFNTMNSLPDSLKNVYLSIKRKQELELIGGCE